LRSVGPTWEEEAVPVSDRKELSVLLLPSSLCMSVCNVLSSFSSAAVWMFNRARARNLLQSLAAANGSILSFSFRLRQSSEICWLSFYQKNVRSSTHVPPPPGKKFKWDKATMELERPSVCPIRPVCPPAFPLPPPGPLPALIHTQCYQAAPGGGREGGS
jgi:hypothetical protein